MNKLIPKFYGTVKEGKLTLRNKQNFELYIGGLTGNIEMTVKKISKTRSLNQNNYYWGVVLKLISDYTGHDPEDLHNHFKYHFLRKEAGNLTTSHSTTELDKIQFGEYLDKIIRFASVRLGVVIPNPEEVEMDSYQ